MAGSGQAIAATRAKKRLEDQLVSLLMRGTPADQAVSTLVNSITSNAPPQAPSVEPESDLDQARAYVSPEEDDYDIDNLGNDPNATPEDYEAARKGLKAPRKIVQTDDDAEIAQKVAQTVRPTQAPPVTRQAATPKADPQAVKSLVDELNQIRHPGHEDQTYLNHLRSISGGNPDAFIASELDAAGGDPQQALQSVLSYIEDDLKSKGMLAPRRAVAQPVQEPADPAQPAALDDAALIDRIRPYHDRKASPKVISDILSAQGIDVPPEKVKELVDQIEAQRQMNRQASVLGSDEIDDEEEVTEKDIEDLVRNYFNDGLSSPREIVRLLNKDHGIKAGADVVKSVLKELMKSFKSYDDDKGVDVHAKRVANDEDPEVQDDEEDDEDDEDETKKSESEAISKFIIANPKMQPAKIARALKKQGLNVDEDQVQDIMMDLYEKGKIKFEGFSFGEWLNRRKISG